MGSDHPDPQTSINGATTYPPQNWDQWWVVAEIEIEAPMEVVWAVLQEWFWDNDTKSIKDRSQMAKSHVSEPIPHFIPHEGSSQKYEHLDHRNISQRFQLITPEHRRLLVDYHGPLKLPRKMLYTRSKHALYRAFASSDPNEDSTKYMIMEVATGAGATFAKLLRGKWDRCAVEIANAVKRRSTTASVDMKWGVPKGGPPPPDPSSYVEDKTETVERWYGEEGSSIDEKGGGNQDGDAHSEGANEKPHRKTTVDSVASSSSVWSGSTVAGSIVSDSCTIAPSSPTSVKRHLPDIPEKPD